MENCFWTDLVNVAQQCDSAPAVVLKIIVENGFTSYDTGHIEGGIPAWLDLVAGFTVEIGECTAVFVDDVGYNRLEVSGLPICPYPACEGLGTLFQNGNTAPVEIEIWCS